jgi:DNA-binding transcriptional MerR regulator
MEKLWTIGEVARQAGVSVQTLRHYDQLGLLPPAAVTESGYRLYSARESQRLELIRTLRDAGFDLATIGQLLSEKQSVREAVALQLEVLEAQQRSLRRQQTLLKAVLEGQEVAMLSRLRRLNVLARLSRHEREAFLARQLGWDPEQPQGSSDIWEAAVFSLPEELTEAQLEAWLELAELAADEGFQQALKRQWDPFTGVDEARMRSWTEASQALMTRIKQAVGKGESAEGEVVQEIITNWIASLAHTLERSPDLSFVRWTAEHLQTTSDPRFERYWQLVAVLKGWTCTNEIALAHEWLLAGLRAKLTSQRQ